MRLVYPEMQPNAVRNLATPRVASNQTELGCAWGAKGLRTGWTWDRQPSNFPRTNPPATSQSPPRHDVACSWCFDDNSQDAVAPTWKLANVRTTPFFKLPDRDSEDRNYREE